MVRTTGAGGYIGGETNLVDFKRQWHDFQKNDQKAEFAHDMLAMANSATVNDPGVLLMGVEDDGTIVGVNGNRPTDEAIAQVLAVYTMPPVASSVVRVDMSGIPVDVIEVPHSAHRPYYAIRDSGILKRDVFYVRRGSTTGTLTLPEIAAMMREGGGFIKSDPLELGFVDYINWDSGLMTARVANLIEEPVSGVYVTIELALPYPPHLIRSKVLVNATLKPRESQELKLDIIQTMSTFGNNPQINPRSNLRYRWINVTLHLVYRDRAGYVRSKQETLALGD